MTPTQEKIQAIYDHVVDSAETSCQVATIFKWLRGSRGSRRDCDMFIEEVALKAGLNAETVRRAETGAMSVDTMFKIFAAHGQTAHIIITKDV